MTSYEFAVQALVDVGFSRATAELQVRKQLTHLTPPTPTEPTKDENVLEKAEQLEIRKLFCGYGFNVRNLSQYRPSKVAKGLPDLFVAHRVRPIALFWESKRQIGGSRTGAQVEFGNDCIRCGVGYGFGDRYAAVEKLIELELAVRGDGPYGIVPIRDAEVRA